MGSVLASSLIMFLRTVLILFCLAALLLGVARFNSTFATDVRLDAAFIIAVFAAVLLLIREWGIVFERDAAQWSVALHNERTIIHPPADRSRTSSSPLSADVTVNSLTHAASGTFGPDARQVVTFQASQRV
jgi:hypothetical protein